MLSHVIKSFNGANCFESKAVEVPLHEIGGFSGVKTRHFYNNICSLEFPDRPTRYLEVGTYTGSTLCAALYKNSRVKAYAVDNFSEFDGTREKLDANLAKYVPGSNIHFIDTDFLQFDFTEIKEPIDIYLYDGPHGFSDHYEGIKRVWPILATESVVIVDDWNWPDVRNGTESAFKDLGANIVERFEIKHTWTDNHTGSDGNTDERTALNEFWNGMGVFIIKK
jgi:predicted O-methyltransferase YrrM